MLVEPFRFGFKTFTFFPARREFKVLMTHHKEQRARQCVTESVYVCACTCAKKTGSTWINLDLLLDPGLNWIT